MDLNITTFDDISFHLYENMFKLEVELQLCDDPLSRPFWLLDTSM